MIKFSIRTFDGDVAFVKLGGRLVLGLATHKFRDLMTTLIANEYRLIVIDVEAVKQIDCAGLGELVRAYAEAQRSSTRVYLRNINKRFQNILIITKLVSVFTDSDISLPHAA